MMPTLSLDIELVCCTSTKLLVASENAQCAEIFSDMHASREF